MIRFLKILLLLLTLLVVSIPLIQQQFKFIPDNCTLSGAFNEATDTTLNYSTWFNRNYQGKKELYLNENFGFRNFLVKLYKQIDFSFFKEINLPDVFIGKNDYLFSSSFFNCYSGRVYKGDKFSDSVFTNVQRLNDWLVARNKKLLLCITPSKESFYSEFLPDSCLPFINKKNYYSYYKQKALSNNIPLLDFNTYFLQIKKKSPYLLFNKNGLHWTTYGTYLALDSLLKKMSSELNKKLNLIRLSSFTLSDSAMYTDDDIGETMNLLSKIKSEKLAYPKVEYVYNQDSCYKPKVMIIGDSFYQSISTTWIPSSFFSKESWFLYYLTLAIPYDPNKKNEPYSKTDLEKELENTDIVLFFFSVGRLDEFSKHVKTLTLNDKT